MATHTPLSENLSRELEVLKLSVLFDHHFFNGSPTQVHFTHNSSMVGAWVDEQGGANLTVGLDLIQFMSSDQLAFLIAHEYSHLVLNHPEQTIEIQKQYGVASSFDEFMLSADLKRDYSKLMRDMELQADLMGTQLVLGLGRDPELGAAFLLGETKGIQHPEGTLRVAKIKIGKDTLVPEDFSATFNEHSSQLGDAQVMAALVPNPQTATYYDSAVKAVIESRVQTPLEKGHSDGTQFGFEVSAVLTLAVLACAIPSWWRKTSIG